MMMARRGLAFLFLSLFGVVLPSKAQLSIDVNMSADKTLSGTTIQSPVFSTSAPGELILAFFSADGPGGGSQTIASVACGGLAWSLASRSNVQPGDSEIWEAFAPAVVSNAVVTGTLGNTRNGWHGMVTVLSFIGVDPSGAKLIGATNSCNASGGAPICTVTTTVAGSRVFGVGHDWDNPVPRTVPAGQTMVHEFVDTSVGDDNWVQSQAQPMLSAGSAAPISDTLPTTDRWDLAVVEVVPASQATSSLVTIGVTGALAFDDGTPVQGTVIVSQILSNGKNSYMLPISSTGTVKGTVTINPAVSPLNLLLDIDAPDGTLIQELNLSGLNPILVMQTAQVQANLVLWKSTDAPKSVRLTVTVQLGS